MALPENGNARHIGRLDIICNNAGTISMALTEDISEQDRDHVIGVKLKGTFLGCKYAIPTMKPAQGGSIIDIGSVNSMVGSAGYELMPDHGVRDSGGWRIYSALIGRNRGAKPPCEPRLAPIQHHCTATLA